MLFSGLGPDAQNQLGVGVGALAGSTIMLLTVPWGAAVIAGRVGIGPDGLAHYGIKRKRAGGAGAAKPDRRDVLAKKMGGASDHVLTSTGVSPAPSIKANAYVMMATSLVYLVIQGPAFPYWTDGTSDDVMEEVSSVERWWALAGLVIALLAFCGYLLLMVQQASSDENLNRIDSAIIKALQSDSPVTLSGVLYPMIADGQRKLQEQMQSRGLRQYSATLLDKDRKRLATVLHPFFLRYDTDGDGKIDVSEMHALLADVNEHVTPENVRQWMVKLDPDGSGSIETAEFVDAMLLYITSKAREYCEARRASMVAKGEADEEEDDEDDEDDEEEDVEIPDDLQELDWQEQQRHVKMRAAKMMGIGTALILVFSDPMVDVMSNMGERLGIPPFYVAFVLAPLASNASEFIASYNYAAKKTQKTITVSLAALEGAACMNNTFCLSIFMGVRVPHLLHAIHAPWHTHTHARTPTPSQRTQQR